MSLLQRARESGKCPPSLLGEERMVEQDGFETGALKILDGTTFAMAPGANFGVAFMALLQKATSIDSIPAATPELKKQALEQRRCILLGIIGSSPAESASIDRVLSSGYLGFVRGWLEDILGGSVGGMDLLLQLLSTIVDLPVTKSVVKDSGMGRAIGTIEKHSICTGTPNEAALLDRVAKIKDAWNASVKARKAQNAAAAKKVGEKRESPGEEPSLSSAAKRPKVEEDTKKPPSAVSALMKRVAGPTNGDAKAEKSGGSPTSEKNGVSGPAKKKNASVRVKWADHFGGELAPSKIIEGENAPAAGTAQTENAVSWTDRKKRDRAREKELLSKMKKSKLLDDDEEEGELVPTARATVAWREPSLLAKSADIVKAEVKSTEIAAQVVRMTMVSAVAYVSDSDVPDNPAPLTNEEQAADMTSQSSANVGSIPFFVPVAQPEPAPAPAPLAQPANLYQDISNHLHLPTQPTQPPTMGATVEFVLGLGLPLFLVGQNVKALQTLAQSPGLLGTFLDSSGNYDQPRLISLVQTLSAGSQGNNSNHTPNSGYSAMPSSTNMYGPSSTLASHGNQPAYSSQGAGGFRGRSDDGNLHVSGYGPATSQADIIALFSPYVQVEEVVMKGTFCFVNTRDPMNAQRARELLHGTLLGGMPIRINSAQRKNKDASTFYGGNSGAPAPPTYAPPGVVAPTASFPGSSFGGALVPGSSFGGAPVPGSSFGGAPAGNNFLGSSLPTAPAPVMGQMNVDAARDDRGNSATKNLFVAGYGQGTTEQQLRDIFGMHVSVIGVVLKGNFSFVNTASREDAVKARQMLNGTQFNGGPLRINFAKETGRLGTSFDITYNERSGPNAKRALSGMNPGQAPQPTYYGRGGF